MRSSIPLFAALICVSCSHASTAHPRLLGPGFWEAVITGSDLRSTEVSITIDPRLVHLEVGRHFPDSSDYRREGLEMIAERRQILNELGLRTGAAFPLRSGCDGILVPPPVKETHGCPEDPEIHVLFDRPVCDGECSMLRFTIRHSEAGRSATLSRILLSAAGGGWRVTAVEHLVAFD